jgi:uncharacterized membrane protein/thiol-disulfide isomerase/thioredoxin
MNKKHFQILLGTLLSVILIFGFTPAVHAQTTAPADQAVVRAVLFYSPTCGHCEYVRNDIFPPLFEKYGSQLEIAEINISTDAGYQLYDLTMDFFQVPENSQGVPFLLIENEYLVGSVDIPENFPALISNKLQADGTTWPQIPEILNYINLAYPSIDLEPAEDTPTEDPPEESTPAPENPIYLGEEEPDTSVYILRFQQDPAANTVAVVTLAGMTIAMVYVGIAFMRTTNLKQWPQWITPLLLVIGFGVAAYLSTIEVSGGEAICGPVGDCNAVQSSPYARLFGVIHIGVLGMIGYLAIGLAWALGRWGKDSTRSMAHMAVFLFTVFGTLFSIYLTFLEPFVIGATCMWCITSAVVMTLLMLNATPVALGSWLAYDDEYEYEENLDEEE